VQKYKKIGTVHFRSEILSPIFVWINTYLYSINLNLISMTRFLKPLLILLALLPVSFSFAQDESGNKDFTSDQWYLKDPATDKVAGIALIPAMTAVAKKTPRKVVVAILDSGLDTLHTDLKGKLWANPGEIPGDGIDNDGDGYVDDVHGWNFLGNAKGEVIAGETLEKTRIYRQYLKTYGRKRADQIPASEKAAYDLFIAARASYEKEFNQTMEQLDQLKKILILLEQNDSILRIGLKTDHITEEAVQQINSDDKKLMEAKRLYLVFSKLGIVKESFRESVNQMQSTIDTKLNVNHNPRYITGDDPLNLLDTIYGNNNLNGTTPGHGTSVSGVVAAIRGNNLGVDGIVDQVEIMLVRIVPGGDERDKDVALAIRYAVNHGAQVINCSFGKEFSPEKWMVDEAVKYAEDHGVLIVHASGNDGQDNDQQGNFPSPFYSDGTRAANWIEVGASTKETGKKLPAGFSNYGKTHVDLFAPGQDIISLDPGDGYSPSSGTSLAAPVVTGVAAFLLSYYPQLSPAQIREIIIKSVTPYGKKRVEIPGSKKKTKMKNLCVSGGVLNAAKAVMLAEEYYKNLPK
jgi:subtilisin family serine protease